MFCLVLCSLYDINKCYNALNARLCVEFNPWELTKETETKSKRKSKKNQQTEHAACNKFFNLFVCMITCYGSNFVMDGY